MSDLIFYTNPQSRGRIVRWMLEEVGAPYKTEIVQYGPQMKTPPYTDLNPMGKVPTVVHAGKVITECAAIIAYLAEAFPQAGLIPPPTQRQDYYRWMFFTAGPYEAAFTNKMLNVQVTPEQSRAVGYGSYDQVVETLAQAVSKHPYITGDKFTAADVYIGSQIGYGLQFKMMPDRPEFVDYYNRIRDRPARVRAEAIDNALIPTPA
ncbi:MAG: glutathione S-transferase family protein [Pseudomonadota bacterium]